MGFNSAFKGLMGTELVARLRNPARYMMVMMMMEILFWTYLSRVPALVGIDFMYLDHKRSPFVFNCLLVSKSSTFLSPSTYTAFFELRYVDRQTDVCVVLCMVFGILKRKDEVQCLSLEGIPWHSKPFLSTYYVRLGIIYVHVCVMS